ncbi:SRPBCC family protein [Pedococcus sp. NPDC057267]|uniref:SRPBCC family protein n=1 Tax=Pedococcus sp. NPDC057267 TaxID=3346077 RepID=UPI0036377529
MLLNNEFEIEADLDRTWALLTDLERIMPCMPGAALDGREGDSYLGNVKIKVGPIGAHFKGTAHFSHKDDAARTAVIAAAGKDPKGQAAVNAQIHARLEPVTGTRTRVIIDTDLDISGRMAQFGRGAIADVSNRLMGQFVSNIGSLLDEPTNSPATFGSPVAPAPAGSPTLNGVGAAATAPAPSRVADNGPSMDVMSIVLPMVKERYGQAISGALVGFLLSWLVFGRKVPRS